MENEKFQTIFSKDIDGDSLLQLKNGKLLFYDFKGEDDIYIYNEKSFQELFKININKDLNESKEEDLNEPIENKIEKDKIEEEESSDESKDKTKEKEYNYYSDCFNKNCIKELSNGLILIGKDHYLLTLKLKDKSYDLKLVKKFKNIIFDVNELSDKRIMVITKKNIFIYNMLENEFISKDKNKYLIQDNWKIIPLSLKKGFHGDFHQYYSSYLLPNNRFLLNSFSIEKGRYGWCGTPPASEHYQSKFIFISLNDFTEIKSTEEFEESTRCILLKDNIIIQIYDNFIIYDINSLEIIKNIEFEKFSGYMYKYDEQHLILFYINRDFYREKGKIKLNILKIQDNDLVKNCEKEKILKFNQRCNRGYPIDDYNDKFLFTLKDKRIIVIFCHGMYLLRVFLD